MDKIRRTALEAALQGGKAILGYYQGGKAPAVSAKADQTPVTDADLASNHVIGELLSATGYPVISEESREIAYEIRKDWSTCWIVDPLDGTKEFLKGNGEFTVNIALCEGHQAVFGVIYAPVSRTLYYGDIREGRAYKTVWDGNGETGPAFGLEQDRIGLVARDPDPLRILVSRSHINPETLAYVESLSVPGRRIELIEMGSALKFGLLAEGKADLYPRFGPTMEWDTAAGSAIVQAVGFQVEVQGTGGPLRYNRENLRNPDFLVRRI